MPRTSRWPPSTSRCRRRWSGAGGERKSILATSNQQPAKESHRKGRKEREGKRISREPTRMAQDQKLHRRERREMDSLSRKSAGVLSSVFSAISGGKFLILCALRVLCGERVLADC